MQVCGWLQQRPVAGSCLCETTALPLLNVYAILPTTPHRPVVVFIYIYLYIYLCVLVFVDVISALRAVLIEVLERPLCTAFSTVWLYVNIREHCLPGNK